MASHVVGYPRMGPKRELKFALESFWDGKSSAEDLKKVSAELRSSIWKKMTDACIKYIPSNTFSYYDQVLDTTAMLGAVPSRYNWTGGEIEFATYFSMARGNASVPAMEMTKWFDTNYHFIVPELGPDVNFSYASHKAVNEYKEAKAQGVDTVPVLVGPVSYLLLSKPAKGVDKSFPLLSLLDKILPIYKEVIAELKAAGASWIQLDEPTLVLDLESHKLEAFTKAYADLESSLSGLNVLVETYFADVPAEAFKTLTALKGVTAFGFDLVRGTQTLELIKSSFPSGKYLFAGVVDGRNIWANDLAASLALLQTLEGVVGKDKLVASTSCSLLHTAVDLINETKLDDEIKSWLAFAAQKVVEVNALAKALSGAKDEAFFSANAAAQASRKSSPRVTNEAVQKASAALQGSDHRRATNVSARLDAQQKKLNLPILPTTTIGSFPQTVELRRVRRLRWESTGDQWWFASPIDWAAANGHYDLVRELLHLDTNLLIKLTSLRRIRRLESVWDDEEQFDDVAKCRSEVAKKLLLEGETKKGHNSLIRAGYGGWLLYTAASAGDVEFVKQLLGRDPFLVFGEGEYGVTDMFYAAARSKNSQVFRLLLESSKGESAEEVSSTFQLELMNRAVHSAARGGNVEMLREILGNCSDVLVYRDAQGSTLLHSASGRGQVEVVKSLLEMYDLINSRDNQGNTALHVAAYRGYLAVVKVLISVSPSSTTLRNNYGDTFLHMAVAGFRTPSFHRLDRQMELMKQLVRGKIIEIEDIINIKNNDGQTALHLAVIENIQTDVVELLMTAFSINLNIRDADGNTPLDLLKLRPQSASSEILIKRLISAGGISNCQDHMTRTVLASHLKMQGIGGSPGASFRIPDAEIFLYAGIDNAFDANSDCASTEIASCWGEPSPCHSAAGSNSSNKLSSVNSAARRLKFLLRWKRKKERKEETRGLEDNMSVESYKLYSGFGQQPIPLRQRFSRMSSFPNNKRVLPVQNSLPSPSTKKKYAAGLMHGVIQMTPQSSYGSPSSAYSESSWSSPVVVNKEKRMDFGNASGGSSSLKMSNSREKSKLSHKHGSFNMKLMNQYFCFGAQGLAVESSVSCAQQDQHHRHPVVA